MNILKKISQITFKLIYTNAIENEKAKERNERMSGR